jgi:hypothetical protein
LSRKLGGLQSWSGCFGEAEKFLSPAGILGYATHSLVIVLKKGHFLYMMSIGFGPFAQERCGMKREFQSFFGQLTQGNPLVKFDCPRAFTFGNRNELTANPHPGPECVVGVV